MYIFLVQYDDFGRNTSVFSSFDKAKKDVINYVNNGDVQSISDWSFEELEELKKDWDEIAKSSGFDNWEQGILYCPYKKINMYLGEFVRIEKVQVNKSIWEL